LNWSAIHCHAESLRLPAIPTLVVAPHPDDEVLLAGGLIATQRTRDVEIHVLAVTDGEAAYPKADRRELAARRRSEQDAALGELGVTPAAVTRLGLPDGSVADCADELRDAMVDLGRFGLVVAPWTGDHHCDHEATGEAVRTAVALTGAALLFGLFWTWHRRLPKELIDERMVALELSPSAQQRRQQALRCHRSQFSDEYGPAQLTSNLVEPTAWEHEYYLAPRPLIVHGARDPGRSERLLTGVPPVTAGPSEVQT
jgi:LmbE family N-acetylglucosaminyl deacetylase